MSNILSIRKYVLAKWYGEPYYTAVVEKFRDYINPISENLVKDVSLKRKRNNFNICEDTLEYKIKNCTLKMERYKNGSEYYGYILRIMEMGIMP
jgi:hypothetical protein